MGAPLSMEGRDENSKKLAPYAGELVPLPAYFPIAHCSRPNRAGGGGCLDQCIGGFVLGATLGSVVGVLFGGLQAATAGPEMKGLRLRMFLKTVGGSALSFGVFLAAGSAIRCEEQLTERYNTARHAPIAMPATVTGVGLGAIFPSHCRMR